MRNPFTGVVCEIIEIWCVTSLDWIPSITDCLILPTTVLSVRTHLLQFIKSEMQVKSRACEDQAVYPIGQDLHIEQDIQKSGVLYVCKATP